MRQRARNSLMPTLLAFLLIAALAETGLDAASMGIARWVASLVNCQGTSYPGDQPSQTFTTGADGAFQYNVASSSTTTGMQIPDSGNQSNCQDAFTGAQVPFAMLSLLPISASSSSTTASIASFAAAAQLLPLAWPATTPLPVNPAVTPADVNRKLQSLYQSLGVDLSQSDVSDAASTLQPLQLMRSRVPAERSIGTAIMIAEFQLGVMLTLGAAMLSATCQQVDPPVSLPLGAAASAIAATLNAVTLIDLTDAGAVNTVYMDTASRLLPSEVIEASPMLSTHSQNTAAGVASFASVLQPAKVAAVAGFKAAATNVDVFAAVENMALLSVVQGQAQTAVSGMVETGKPMGLSSFKGAALKVRMDAVVADYNRITQELGLPQPEAAQQTSVIALMVGPLASCSGISVDAYDVNFKNARTDAGGHLDFALRPTSAVSVWKQLNCTDTISGVQTRMSLHSLAIPAAQIVLNPIGILAGGFLDYLSLQSVMTYSSELQLSAYSAVGLDMALYITTIAPGSCVYSVVEPEDYKMGDVMPQAYMTAPYYMAGAAASGQIMTIMLTAIALFCPSAEIIYSLPESAAADLVARFTAAAIAEVSVLSSQAGGSAEVDLTDRNVIKTVYASVKAKCSFNAASTTTPGGRRLRRRHLNHGYNHPDLHPGVGTDVGMHLDPDLHSDRGEEEVHQGVGAGTGMGLDLDVDADGHVISVTRRALADFDADADSHVIGVTRQRRALAADALAWNMYTNHPDFDASAALLTVIVQNFNLRWFQVCKSAALSPGPTWNATDVLLNITKTAVVVQTWYIDNATIALNGTMNSMMALQNAFSPAKMDAMIIDAADHHNVTLLGVCNATGGCLIIHSDSKSSTGSIGLVVGIICGVLGGILLLMLSVYFLYRCIQERKTTRCVHQQQAQHFPNPMYSTEAKAAPPMAMATYPAAGAGYAISPTYGGSAAFVGYAGASAYGAAPTKASYSAQGLDASLNGNNYLNASQGQQFGASSFPAYASAPLAAGGFSQLAPQGSTDLLLGYGLNGSLRAGRLPPLYPSSGGGAGPMQYDAHPLTKRNSTNSTQGLNGSIRASHLAHLHQSSGGALPSTGPTWTPGRQLSSLSNSFSAQDAQRQMSSGVTQLNNSGSAMQHHNSGTGSVDYVTDYPLHAGGVAPSRQGLVGSQYAGPEYWLQANGPDQGHGPSSARLNSSLPQANGLGHGQGQGHGHVQGHGPSSARLNSSLPQANSSGHGQGQGHGQGHGQSSARLNSSLPQAASSDPLADPHNRSRLRVSSYTGECPAPG